MQTTVERVYQKLRQAIVECELSPGTSFSESDLVRRYKASRTPVREACQRLEHEGLVRIVPFRGYSIAPLSVAEFLEMQELQLILEPAAAALAAERITPEQVAELEECALYEYRVGDAESYREFVRKNHQLHTAIASASRNRQLFETVNNIHVRLMRFFFLGLPFESWGETLVEEHRKLLGAIRNRQPEEARRYAAEHIQNAIQRSSNETMNAIRFGELIFDPNSSNVATKMNAEETRKSLRMTKRTRKSSRPKE
ncbi:GntR family transcriptional regulator [Granulicella arctica]|uniref:DNA-binding GntR family transcriptional regulator n=1 Tax=Granulicella arctica TaxID=940613 RepID=A0A7Y9PI88_9BACT|nr:GntR family transcriptional regulator [Granulicella arctica]NYF80234.1 DNA-binding GntR family transcriptional regulator [Granulicella arctica]